jgi:hypothetical protein
MLTGQYNVFTGHYGAVLTGQYDVVLTGHYGAVLTGQYDVVFTGHYGVVLSLVSMMYLSVIMVLC